MRVTYYTNLGTKPKTTLLLSKKKKENQESKTYRDKLKLKSNCELQSNQSFARSPLSADRRQVERPPPSLQITSIFLVFYGLSHGTTLKKKDVVVF